TSTLHQKLKFVKNGKLVIIGGEQALLVSHLSSFSFISASDVDGTQFQGLSLDDKNTKKNGASISSLRDAQEVVQNGLSAGWGQVVTLPENKRREGLGFSPSAARAAKPDVVIKKIEDTFHSTGFIHPPSSEANAIIED
ncbi:receptor-like kinase, partial [Trifolium medium]|nr:receptor-like kinase [Trifolium medium]